MFIDVHCHLDLVKNLTEVIKKCRSENVLRMIAHGVDKETNRTALSLSEKYSEVRVALGIYPEDALKMSNEEFEDEIKFISDNKDKIVAIGEIGLDKKYPDFEKQKELFVKQLRLAKEFDLPVIIHSRFAESEAIEILETEGMKKVVMHCFCGSFKLVERIVKNGWSLSIPANVTFSEQFQANVKFVPIEQLFCETDSPFLHPVKGARNNDPSNVVESYKKIAEIKDLELKEVENILEKNYEKMFN